MGLSASLVYLLGFFSFFLIQFVLKHNYSTAATARRLSDDEDEPTDTARPARTATRAAAPAPVASSSSKPVAVASEQQDSQPACSVVAKEQLAENTDEEILSLVQSGKVPHYSLEKELGDCNRAVELRRRFISSKVGREFERLPFQHYDYKDVLGQCCEMVIGYVPIPVGIAGPLLLDGELVHIPMATTEGCLVASTNRGAKALSESGGVQTVLLKSGITRAPCVRMPSAVRAAELKAWIEDEANYAAVCDAFNSTSRFARLQEARTCECERNTLRLFNFSELTGGGGVQCKVALAGRSVYIRFRCSSGDAMGMNMVSKGCNCVLDLLKGQFPDMDVIAISGNYCVDKKPSAINWIEGRGKSVVAEAVVSGRVVEKVLKTTVEALVDLNTQKNLIGSALAGSVGGFNAHAANIVTAVYIATGQDPAQNVESSTCMTLFERINEGRDLHVSVTMPSVEVGTVGGGTHLPGQAACLDILGVRGSNAERPGANAERLARIVAGAVLAGELSLMSALAAGHLVRAHMQHNRAAPKPPCVSPCQA
eukprot:tig00000241_g20957.t1